MWRAELNKIATVDNLRRRNIEVQDASCVLCNDGEDSVFHIFSSCYVGFKDVALIHEFVGLKGAQKEAFKGVTRIGVWCIWKARNKARFENKEVRIEEIINEVKALGSVVLFGPSFLRVSFLF
ncbi:uncharacterized protein LOC110907284 [Helianthus annuus]|uniref:uncharacterized protein LOC110907284 n=1 Tax=Helianthus annuus TaxID=4232 RepID=UPI000B8F4892|nr:uncharacterized protein LOC110907284 [Helianthus annuus]